MAGTPSVLMTYSLPSLSEHNEVPQKGQSGTRGAK